MHRTLDQSYYTLRELFSSEQSVYILIAEILTCYLRNTIVGSERFKSAEGDIFLHHGVLNYLLVDIEEYGIKEAVCMLDELIDWSYIEAYEAAGALIKKVEVALDGQTFFENGELAADGIQEVLDIAGIESPIISTPADICSIIAEQLFRSYHKIAEFGSGSGRMGAEILKKQSQDKKCDLEYYGEDINPFCCICTRIVIWLVGVKNIQVKSRNSLLFDESIKAEQYDLIVADLPIGKNRSQKVEDGDDRLKNFSFKSIYSEWIFLADILYRLAAEGKAYVLVTRGALVRKNEYELRRMVIEKDWLEAVITLPHNLYPDHNMGRELLVIDKKKWRTGKVVFADVGSYGYRVGRNRCRIQENAWEHICQLLDYLNEVPDDDKDSVIVGTDTIAACGYTWNPHEYLDRQYVPKILEAGIALDEIAVISRGIQISKEEECSLKQNGVYHFLNIKNIENGRIRYDDESEKIIGKRDVWEEKYQIREDDIVITTKGTVIKMALVPPNPPPAFISGNLTIIRVNQKKYHPYVLYEFLQSELGRKNLERIQTGTTIKLINSSSLEQLKVPSYDIRTVLETGERLKKNEMYYQAEMRRLQVQYEKSKEELLKIMEV